MSQDSTVSGTDAPFLVTVTVASWATALVLAWVWWGDLGIERFEEFVVRVIMLGFVALGVSLSALVFAIAKRP